MGIRFYCPNNHKLNVKSHLAGKRGVCPECGAKVNIPLQSEPGRAAPSRRSTDTAERSAELTQSPDERVWYVSTPNGDRFGPTDENGFQNWIREGRVQQNDLVWQEGWPEWKNAQEVLADRKLPQTDASMVPPRPPQPMDLRPNLHGADSVAAGAATGSVQIEVDRPVPQSKRKSTTIVICLLVACLLLIGPLVYVFTL